MQTLPEVLLSFKFVWKAKSKKKSSLRWVSKYFHKKVHWKRETFVGFFRVVSKVEWIWKRLWIFWKNIFGAVTPSCFCHSRALLYNECRHLCWIEWINNLGKFWPNRLKIFLFYFLSQRWQRHIVTVCNLLEAKDWWLWNSQIQHICLKSRPC